MEDLVNDDVFKFMVVVMVVVKKFVRRSWSMHCIVE